MNKLNKDLIAEIALNLDPKDIVNFSLTCKKYNEILNIENFWRKKLEKDYIEELLEFYRDGIILENPKEKYIERFSFIYKQINIFMSEFIETSFDSPTFIDFLNDKYKKGLYDDLYSLYIDKRLLLDIIDNKLAKYCCPWHKNNGTLWYELMCQTRDFIQYLEMRDKTNEVRRELLQNLKSVKEIKDKINKR